MSSNILKILVNSLKFLRKKGPEILITAVFASTITAVACGSAFKKLEEKHRKDDAEKLKAEFEKRLKELEDKYLHNEFLLKKRINELCKEFDIDPVYPFE